MNLSGKGGQSVSVLMVNVHYQINTCDIGKYITFDLPQLIKFTQKVLESAVEDGSKSLSRGSRSEHPGWRSRHQQLRIFRTSM